ncbi:MAG: orotate phosphoribosyltransferase [Candidatus Krumholzibacteriota bacterium]
MNDYREELKEILTARSILKGDFTLVSGKKSSYYINGKMTTLHSRGLYLASRLLMEEFEGLEYGAFAGPVIGADPIIGSLLTLAATEGIEKEGLLIRKGSKEHGTRKLVEGNITEGLRTVIVEDVVTTGGSLLKAAEAVQKEGGVIAGVGVIVDREEGGPENIREAGYNFSAIFRVSELL